MARQQYNNAKQRKYITLQNVCGQCWVRMSFVHSPLKEAVDSQCIISV